MLPKCSAECVEGLRNRVQLRVWENQTMCHIERKMRPHCGLNLSNGGSKQSFNLLTKMISRLNTFLQ